MNVNEVPQDPKNFKGAEQMKKLMYATDKDGKYTGVVSSGWEAENEATKQAWDDVDEALSKVATQVKAGELSPVAYYMQKNLMELGLLAKYVGKWQWQVKRHFKPSVFNKMDASLLQKYADVFSITVEELRNFGK